MCGRFIGSENAVKSARMKTAAHSLKPRWRQVGENPTTKVTFTLSHCFRSFKTIGLLIPCVAASAENYCLEVNIMLIYIYALLIT
jgi:hypothetical protein